MSLIDKAAQHLGQKGKSAAREKAASSPTDSPDAPDTSEVNRAFLPHLAIEALGTAPSARAQGTADPFDPLEAEPLPRRQSRPFRIDFGRLAERHCLTPGDRRSRLAEEVRLIKWRLMQRMRYFDKEAPQRGGLDQVILVTSARPGEGKSFLSLNLALSFAMDEGLNVLLVNADLRKPGLLDILGLDNDRGLAEVLHDPSMDLSEVLLREETLPLSLLPGGRVGEGGTELFGGERMLAFIEEVAYRYPDRIVIFDSPPLLAATEPFALAQHLGQIVFVVEAQSTSESTIQAALDLLDPCDNVSLVLNKAPHLSTAEQFGSYYAAYQTAKKPTHR